MSLTNLIFLAQATVSKVENSSSSSSSGSGFGVSTILQNLIEFAKSMPTNMVILAIVCIIMYLFGKSIGACVKVVVIYLLIGLLLGIIGIRMPNFLEIANWVKEICSDLW